jgi:hypothetical protein
MPDCSRRLSPKADTAGSPSRKSQSTPAGVAALWHPSGMRKVIGSTPTGDVGLTASTTGYRLGTLPGSSDADGLSDARQATAGKTLRRATTAIGAIHAALFPQA